jgi:hypothetical protein
MDMKDRWPNFYKVHSSVDIAHHSTGNNNILADWQRAANDDPEIGVKVTVNGEPLSKFSKIYNDFKTQEDLKQFFREEILKFVDAGKDEKDRMLQYLLKSFHQGGFMYPISASLGDSIKTFSLTMRPDKQTQDVHIVSTLTGFKVQELYNSLSFTWAGHKQAQYLEPDDLTRKSVLAAEGTIDVDMSTFKGSSVPDNVTPIVRVESNTLSYGNSMLQSAMDNRSLAQRIVDFFKNILGLAHVTEISPTNTSSQAISSEHDSSEGDEDEHSKSSSPGP